MVALQLVMRRRMRLVDHADSRLGALAAGGYVLSAATWTGRVAAFVGFYEPPPVDGAADLQRRLEAAWSWANDRLAVQGAERASVLLVALGPVDGTLAAVPPASGSVRVGAAIVNAAAGEITSINGPVPGLPSPTDLRHAAESVTRGEPVPTLAAVDLAERQTVAGGYVAPARRAFTMASPATVGLIGACVAVYIVELAALHHFDDPRSGVAVYDAMYLAVGAEPSTSLGALGAPGDWWRAVAAGLVHAAPGGGGLGILHILSNALGLWFLGRPIEQLYGRLALLSTFVVAVVAGNVAFLLVHQGSQLNIGFGASGGVFGLIGLVVMLGRVQGRDVPVGIAAAMRQWALTLAGLNLLFGFTVGAGAGISNSAHIGGLLAGVLMGLIVPPRAEIGGRGQRTWERALLGGVLAVAAVAMGFAGAHLADQLTTTFLG